VTDIMMPAGAKFPGLIRRDWVSLHSEIRSEHPHRHRLSVGIGDETEDTPLRAIESTYLRKGEVPSRTVVQHRRDARWRRESMAFS